MSRYRKPSHDAILDAAAALFLEHGYPTTSMDTIAKEAGVVRATVYNNFRDKEEILAGIATRYQAGFAAIPAKLRVEASPDQSSFDQIEALIREAFGWKLANAELRPLIDLANHLPRDDAKRATEAADDAMRTWMLEIHTRDAERGAIREGFDIDFATAALYRMIDATLMAFDPRGRTSRSRSEHLVHQLTLLHWHAIYVIAPEESRPVGV